MLTAALCAAILSGALGTGESLHKGLFRDLNARLGNVRSGVVRTRGLFSASLADRIPDSQSALMLRGEMLDSRGVVCADDVNIIGVHSRKNSRDVAAGTVSVNKRAAEILSSLNDDVWSYRFEKPSYFSVELPLGDAGGRSSGRTFVSEIVPFETDLITEDFNPSPASVLPVNILVSQARLAAAVEVDGSANVLLSSLSSEELRSVLNKELKVSDLGLDVTALTEVRSEIKSREIFLPEAFCDALEKSQIKSSRALFHLADDFRSVKNTNSAPYGFVAALTPEGSVLPNDLGNDEIVINRWLADRLDIIDGDEITLNGRRFESLGELVPQKRIFKVRKIMSMETAMQVRERMPDFPGLQDVDSCSDWDIGMPLDETKLNDAANEEYWKQFRQTPMAFMTYEAGCRCFGTAFGSAMSIQLDADVQAVDSVLKNISPESIGFAVRDLWDEGVAAAKGSTDFRGLFVGMAFILMFSALLLSGLSLSLTLDSRAVEPALFSALGFKRHVVMILLLKEWSVTLVAGAMFGGVCGIALSRIFIWGLSRFWRDAFAGAAISFHFSTGAVLSSVVLTLIFLFLILAVKIYRCAGSSPIGVLKGLGHSHVLKKNILIVCLERTIGPLCAVGAVLVMWGSSGSQQVNSAFFGAGFLLMISVLFFLRDILSLWSNRFCHGRAVVKSSFVSGLIRAAHSGRRGKTLVVLLAVGFFLSVGMLAMKHDPAAGWEKTSSGSGGFMAIVRSAFRESREKGVELAQRVTGSELVVPVRVKEGDEAGCMNMSVPQVPRLYGMPVDQMAVLRAFEPEDSGGIWNLLRNSPEKGVIPALASDQAMLQYSLKMKAGVEYGDEISYSGKDGHQWRIRIVGVLPVRVSILQGGLLLNEADFVKMFPGEGYRMWLTDYAPYELRENDAFKLRYPEPGVHVETTVERLRTLGKMESNYLDMFLVLGGFGLALGVIGVALVIARSIEERRYEFALLQALGIKKKYVMQTILTEFGALTLAGVMAGFLPAMVAVQPAARSLSSGINWALVGGVVTVLMLTALLSVMAGALYALRGFDISLLKRE